MRKCFVIVIVILSFTQISEAQVTKENREYVYDLHRNIDTEKLQQYPLLVREKMQWIVREQKAKRLVLTIADRFYSVPPWVMMASGYKTDGKPQISVSVDGLARLGKANPNIDMQLMYILCLVHEAIHLEFKKTGPERRPDIAVGSEEIYVWHKWLIGAVRPMRYRASRLQARLLEIEDILRSCGDNINCPEFVRVVANNSSIGLK